MSHYLAFVAIDAEVDVEELVREAMSPHREGDESPGVFDWYQIGGRWTGHLDGYDPEKDPANLDSRGEATWPTKWKSHPGDVALVDALAERVEAPYALVDEDGIHLREKFVCLGNTDPGRRVSHPNWVAEFKDFKERNKGRRVVVVDYHS
jgi:hypothetical protein